MFENFKSNGFPPKKWLYEVWVSSIKYNPFLSKVWNNNLKDLITSFGKWLPSSIIISNFLYFLIIELINFGSDCEPLRMWILFLPSFLFLVSISFISIPIINEFLKYSDQALIDDPSDTPISKIFNFFFF